MVKKEGKKKNNNREEKTERKQKGFRLKSETLMIFFLFLYAVKCLFTIRTKVHKYTRAHGMIRRGQREETVYCITICGQVIF